TADAKAPDSHPGLADFRPLSISRDHRAAESVVDPHRAHVDGLLDGVDAVDGVDRRERHAVAAHEQMVVFEGHRPARPKAELDAGAYRAAPPGFARGIDL